jgi:D-amino-acid oxidase
MSNKDGCKWEKNTWPELARLAKDVPEAGMHFQGRLLQISLSRFILHI